MNMISCTFLSWAASFFVPPLLMHHAAMLRMDSEVGKKIFFFVTAVHPGWKTWTRNGAEFVAGFVDQAKEERVKAIVLSERTTIDWDVVGPYYMKEGKVFHRYLNRSCALPTIVAAEMGMWEISDNYSDFSARFFHQSCEISIPVCKHFQGLQEWELTRAALQSSASKHIDAICARLCGDANPKSLDGFCGSAVEVPKKGSLENDLRPRPAKTLTRRQL